MSRRKRADRRRRSRDDASDAAPSQRSLPAPSPEPSLDERRAFTDEVLARLRAASFSRVGICDARPSERAAEFRRWLSEGRHGDMAYMAEHVDERLDPAVLVPGARSVICVADRYHDGRHEPAPDPASRPRGRVARYARGGDYHEIIRARLEPLAKAWRTWRRPHRFRVCVDTAPIMEREHARRAGLGRIGKHTLLIAEGLGSWLSLGEIVTTYPLLPTPAAPFPANDDPCGACTRCIDSCPTGAISPWSVDATKCLSYLTIEHAGDVAPELETASGDWLFGCDDCQEVCPHNQPTRRSRRAGASAGYESRTNRLDLLEILGWSEADYAAANFTAVIRRASLPMLKRTSIAILGNHLARHDSTARESVSAGAAHPPEAEVAEVRRRLESLARDPREDPVVRRAAQRYLD